MVRKRHTANNGLANSKTTLAWQASLRNATGTYRNNIKLIFRLLSALLSSTYQSSSPPKNDGTMPTLASNTENKTSKMQGTITFLCDKKIQEQRTNTASKYSSHSKRSPRCWPDRASLATWDRPLHLEIYDLKRPNTHRVEEKSCTYAKHSRTDRKSEQLKCGKKMTIVNTT